MAVIVYIESDPCVQTGISPAIQYSATILRRAQTPPSAREKESGEVGHNPGPGNGIWHAKRLFHCVYEAKVESKVNMCNKEIVAAM